MMRECGMWIHPAEDRDYLRDLVNTVMNFFVFHKLL
jgi:hypothetical protein